MIRSYRATLTSDASGDASATIKEVPVGKVIGVGVVNSGDSQPDNNWDLDISNLSWSSGSTAVPNDILVDTSVSQAVTAVQWYNPSRVGSNPDTGAALTLNDNIFVITKGPITVVGANMGASKIAYVEIVVEH